MNSNCCTGITVPQCHVLLEIEELSQATTVQLAKNLKLDKSTLSRTVDGLVKAGLVERKTHPSDRRYTILILTEQGKKSCEHINRENDGLYDRVFQQLPRETRDTILGHFESLVRVMEVWYLSGKKEDDCC
jgi:DNA-binding MarR family transcriptional regulator